MSRQETLTPEALVELLGLEPLEPEGGFFRQTYRGDDIPVAAGGGSSRPAGTVIYFLVTEASFSALHRLRFDEVYHFYLGDALEMVHLYPDGKLEQPLLGVDLAAGERPQVQAPGGCWQGSRLRSGGRFALVGTSMAPGFHFDDFEMGERQELVHEFPQHADLIRRFTRP